MKVVYNPKGVGLFLNAEEMRMFCQLRGWRLCTHPPVISSETTWFADSAAIAIRTDPLLVRLVESGMCSNAALRVHTWDERSGIYSGQWELYADATREWVVVELMREREVFPAYEDDCDDEDDN